MSEVEKDVCLECGVEIVDGGSWGYCVPCGNEVFDKLIQNIGRGLMNEQDNFKESYNVHDPHEQYVWADDDLPWWVRVLYGVAFLGLLAALTVFGLLL
jgi:hypothetical protein